MKEGRKKGCLFAPVAGIFILITAIFAINSKTLLGAPPDPNFFYYSDGRKISLPISKEKIAVRFNPSIIFAQQEAAVESEINLASFSERKYYDYLNMTILPLIEDAKEDDVLQTINNLISKTEVNFTSPVFHFSGAELILTDEFLVKFKPNVSVTQIESLNTLHNVEIVNKTGDNNIYTLKVKDPNNMNSLNTANIFYENPITIFSMPNFIRKIKLSSVIPDDTYFLKQWTLENTGEYPSYGTFDADIDAPEGWEISTGSSDIVIAIIDSGVDLTHEDLVNKIVGGKDYVDNDNNPTPGNYPEDAHGTSCAGLAAAETNNGKGIAGVGWSCKIMPIRVFGEDWYTEEQWLIDSIVWASVNGADVLSNSWTSGFTPSDFIHDAIKYAKNNGRDGKGCVIVFSSGNDNTDVVYYPAKRPEVLAVGATNHKDRRWYVSRYDGSNYGNALDVVAPSGWDLVNGVPMWTTDISGSAGDNPGNIILGRCRR